MLITGEFELTRQSHITTLVFDEDEPHDILAIIEGPCADMYHPLFCEVHTCCKIVTILGSRYSLIITHDKITLRRVDACNI